MTQIELEKLYLETEHGIFTPIYNYEEYDQETDTYTGLIIIKTAQEVYDEWLTNKDKPVEPPLDKISILEGQLNELSEYTLSLEMKSLETEEAVIMNSEYVLDLDARLTNIESKN